MSKRIRKPSAKAAAAVDAKKPKVSKPAPKEEKMQEPEEETDVRMEDVDDPDLAGGSGHFKDADSPKAPVPRKSSFTLYRCFEIINALANPDTTKEIYNRCLANLAIFASAAPQAFNDMTSYEASARLKDFDMGKLIRNFDRTVEVVENIAYNRKNGQPISVESKCQMYKAICKLFGKGTGKFEVDKTLKDAYNKKVKDFDVMGNAVRDLNAPKRGVAEHPDFTWEKAQAIYTSYIDTESMTNTKTGNHRLRIATILGFYILQRPRRVQDYQLLQLYSKYPASHPKDKNILVMDKDKATIYIDKFKTRWTTKGSSKTRKEVLPLYKKELNPRLVSLLKDYIKHFGIKDKQYLFAPEGGNHNEPYSDKSFGTAVASSLSQIMKRKKIGGVNTLRHWFNTFVTENYNQYNDGQRKEIALDVGDTPRNPSTNMRYTIANQANKDKSVTEIQGDIHERDRANDLAILEAEEEGSVGDINEVQQPAKHVELDRRIQDLASAGAVIDAFYSLMRPVLIDLINQHRE